MNEIKRFKIWWKERIEDWEVTIAGIGFVGITLNFFAIIVFLVIKSPIVFLFLTGLIVWGFGIKFLTHEYEIEKSEENLKTFFKDIDEHFKKATALDYIKIASRSYETIPYYTLMKALKDHGFYAKTHNWGPHLEDDYWESFEEKDYDYKRALYVIKRSD